MTTAPDSCIHVFPTRQSLGTKRFDVIRQTQNVTANTTNVTDSPRCPAELVFSDILLVFIVVPSTLATAHSAVTRCKYSKIVPKGTVLFGPFSKRCQKEPSPLALFC